MVERYTIEAQLGEGGMAVVYRVRHNQLGSLHAMKVLTVPGGHIRQRLLQEGRVQATLRHPNIVSVTDVVDVDGAPGLIMEFVDGPSLDRLLERYRPRLEEAEALAVGIILGVAAAHKHGLIHRDLKPGNVLIANSDAGPVPKVADFGLAKALATEQNMSRTRSGVAMGTPSYMAPEQIKDAKNVDKRADVFALGCVLYELVAGKQAFPGGDLMTVFSAITEGRFAPLPDDVPERISSAIHGALAVDRESRTPDCESLLRAWRGESRTTSAAWSQGLMASLATSQPEVQTAPVSPATFAQSVVRSVPDVSADLSLEQVPRPPPRRWPIVVGGGVLGLAVTLGLAWFAMPEPPTPAPVVAAEPQPVEPPTPEPAAAPVEVVASKPAPPPAAIPKPKPTPIAAPEPPKPAPTPESAPAAAPTTATVVIKGDAKRVWLESAAGRFPAGEVPPGTYRVTAFFDGGEPVNTGEITVAVGETKVLRCSAQFLVCR